LRLANNGLRNGQTDPACSCKLRILKAELILGHHADQAIELLSAPCPVALDGTDFPIRREMLLGSAYAVSGNSQAAEAHFAKADQLAASKAPQLLANIALARGDLAGQDLEKARGYYDQAATLAQKAGLQKTELDARVDLGYKLMQLQDFSHAIDQFLAVLGLIEKLPRTPHNALEEERALGNLGDSYLELGDFDQGVPRLKDAESAAAKLGDKKGECGWALALGNAYLSLQKYAEAKKQYALALQNAQERADTDDLANAYHDLDQLELAQVEGDVNRAEDYNRKAYQAKGLKLDDSSNDYFVLTTAEIAKKRKLFPQAEDLLRRLLDKLEASLQKNKDEVDTSLLWQAQTDIAEVFVGLGDYDDAEKAFRKAVQIVEEFSIQVPKEEDRMSVFDAGPFYDEYIQLLIDRSGDERALQTAEVSRARDLADAFGINAQQRASGLQVSRVQGFLKAHQQIILAYWLSDKESYLWVITPSKFKLFRLPGKNLIDAAVEANRHQIEDDHRRVSESTAGKRLYEMLIKPAKELIPKNARVIIVPNRSLYKLNFETLVVPGPKPRYWIEDVQVEYESSLALLVGSKRHPQEGVTETLVMGAPLEVDKDFPVLPLAGDEVKMVAGHYPAGYVRVITGKDATPGAYRSSDPGRYRYVYFVSHGTASETRPLDSAIILSSDPDGSYKLLARDIKAVTLHADLVIVSACYGLGSKAYSGEGIVGLAWAFMRAGAHQVIAALWAVDETASLRLMNDFYNGFTKGKSAASALREAKLKMLHSPEFENKAYYWASLQLYTGY
jgi:CHAT domain-containing protein